ncbi:hypothetical protein K490DRAFT_62700 [Saccharata proteae CBS 121410]|uniref:Uncharacterized protein n=1 Tax=Saccharata proteae CBS 121410 TaxID=1314787 RepID=A0A9P4HZK7_9PEZI|nr:hypothetical protein K490DRAFT_62700 [Saccharata proteae CBS 121410]
MNFFNDSFLPASGRVSVARSLATREAINAFDASDEEQYESRIHGEIEQLELRLAHASTDRLTTSRASLPEIHRRH